MHGITRYRVIIHILPQRGSFLARRCVHSNAANIRNIALMAHIDSGKTTLTESILHASEYVASPGSVDSGSTTTDFLPAERERGITIQSASIPVHWKQWTFNLIDTPGHADFGMEVESASRVVDGAIVLLDGVEGVEAQTKGVWSQLNRHKVPTRLLFVNKLDRAGASLRESLLSVLSNQLHPRPVLLSLPVASFSTDVYHSGQPGIEGIVDLVKWQAIRWEPPNDASNSAVQTDLPENLLVPDHPLLPALKQARTDLIDLLSIHSPELMEEFLSLDAEDPYLALPAAKILPHLRELTARKEILPVFCGSAIHHIGTKTLMDYIGELLASPVDVDNVSQNTNKRGTVSLLAWKVSWDKQKGWMTFVRVYGGTLTRSTMLYNTATQQKERISKLLLCYASEQKEVDSLPFGSVGMILGLKHTRTGDTLVSANTTDHSIKSSMQSITAPPATISASVVSQSQSDIQLVHNALNSLTRTDPSVRWTEEDGQTLVHGLGALHLEIVEGRLRDEFGAHFSLGRRRVNYKETFPDIGEVSDSLQWDKDILGKPARASLEITVRRLKPTEEGDSALAGNLVLNTDGKSLPAASSELSKIPLEVAAIIQGLQGPLSASPFSALPITSVCIIIIKSFSLAPGSPPAALTSASSLLLRQILKNAGSGDILEPFINVKVDVPENFMGKIVKDLTENGGEIQDMLTDSRSLSSIGDGHQGVMHFSTDGLYIPPAWITPSAMTTTNSGDTSSRQKRSVHALAPLSKMLDYQSRLRAVSGGQATFEMNSVGYMETTPARKLEILQELGRA